MSEEHKNWEGSIDSQLLVERALVDAFIATDSYHDGYRTLTRLIDGGRSLVDAQGKDFLQTAFETAFKKIKFKEVGQSVQVIFNLNGEE